MTLTDDSNPGNRADSCLVTRTARRSRRRGRAHPQSRRRGYGSRWREDAGPACTLALPGARSLASVVELDQSECSACSEQADVLT
jgi:hypothetical protein